MKKKIAIVVTAIALLTSMMLYSGAESSIVDSMDFQDKGIELTLEDAIAVMMEDNPEIKGAKLDLEQAKVSYDKKRSEIRKADDLRDAAESLPVFVTVPTKNDIKQLELIKDFTKANAQRNYDATVERLKAEIEEAYFGLLQAQQMLEINKANMDVSKELYDQTQKKFELGLVTKQDVLNSELNYIKAQKEYQTAEDTVKKAKMHLNMQLGYDVMTDIKLKDTLTYQEWQIESIAEAISKALVHRNEMKAKEFAYELEKLNMDSIAGKYPEITFMYKEQKVKLEKAKKDLEDMKKAIEVEVRNYYLDVLNKQEEIKSGQKSVELAEEALRLTKLSYDIGMTVATDVQKAQTALQQAKLGLSKAILDYKLAVLNFEDAIGVGRRTIALSM